MENSSQIAWKLVPLRHFFPLKAVPLIELLLYVLSESSVTTESSKSYLKFSRQAQGRSYASACLDPSLQIKLVYRRELEYFYLAPQVQSALL
jgi:hypothetical protein